MTRRQVTAWSLAVTVLVPSGALARDPEKAARLFQEGRAAMDAHDVVLACQKFAESEAEDPREGTLINLARCEEARGKLAVSRQYWQQAADLARFLGDPRVEYDLAQLARIDGRVPRLTVRLDGETPPDAVVRRDGIEFNSGSFGVALPVETGRHSITVVAKGHAPAEYTLELVEGEHRDVRVGAGPRLELPRRGADIAVAPEREPSVAVRGVAYGLGGLGIVALGTGLGFGIAALSDASAAAGHCQGDLCDAARTRARTDEQAAATVATDLLLSGIAATSAGAGLRILTPSASETPFVRRRLAYLTGGLGLAAVSVGLVFGARAYEQERESAAGCPHNGDICDAQGAAARRGAIAAGNLSTVSLVVGGALLAGGTVLWLTDPGRHRATLGFSLDGLGKSGVARLQGSW